MSTVANAQQLHIRLTRLVPLNIAQAVSARDIHAACLAAWDNGWRDPEWLAKLALEGTGQGTAKAPGGLFLTQLRHAASMPCPIDRTPTPPPVTEVVADLNRCTTDPATPEQRAHHMATIRATILRHPDAA